MCKRFLLFAIITLFTSYAIASSDVSPVKQPLKSQLEVTNAWARPSMSSNNNSAVYLTINNKSDQQFTLIGASSGVANNVELHKTYVDNKGVTRMTLIDKIVIPSNSTIQLKPADAHIMLFDLKTILKKDDTFILNLNFEDSDTIATEVVVKDQQN